VTILSYNSFVVDFVNILEFDSLKLKQLVV